MSVTNKPIMLNDVMLNVIILNVVAPFRFMIFQRQKLAKWNFQIETKIFLHLMFILYQQLILNIIVLILKCSSYKWNQNIFISYFYFILSDYFKFYSSTVYHTNESGWFFKIFHSLTFNKLIDLHPSSIWKLNVI